MDGLKVEMYGWVRGREIWIGLKVEMYGWVRGREIWVC